MKAKVWKAAAVLGILVTLLARRFVPDRTFRLPAVLEPHLQSALQAPMDRAAQALAMMSDTADFAGELQRLYGMDIRVDKAYSKARLCTPYQALRMAVDRYRNHRGSGEGYRSRQFALGWMAVPVDTREHAYMVYGPPGDRIRVSFDANCRPLRIIFDYYGSVYVEIELARGGVGAAGT